MAMPFPLVEGLECVEALFPLRGQDSPYEAKRVEPLTAMRQHHIFVCALSVDPLS